jgi:hypothetical protein
MFGRTRTSRVRACSITFSVIYPAKTILPQPRRHCGRMPGRLQLPKPGQNSTLSAKAVGIPARPGSIIACGGSYEK